MRKKLHDYERILEREFELLKETPISKENKEKIKKYNFWSISRELSDARVIRNSNTLRKIAKILKKDFEEATEEDMQKLLIRIKKQGYAEATIDGDKAVLKHFYKWLNGGEKYPDCVKWIKRKGLKNNKLPDEMLEPEEVQKIIKAANNKRDKAIVSLVWESGAHIGEIGGMQVKNVAFDKTGCRVMLDGKTGMRRIMLINSAPYLVQWMNEHPKSEDPQEPLWITLKNPKKKQLSYRYFTKMLKATAKRAGIKKPANPPTSGTQEQPASQTSSQKPK